MALLELRPGREDPYAIYDRLRKGMRDAGPGHLSFSSGIHYCIGQSLARLEAAIALRMLAERMPGLARDGSVQRRNATTIRGPRRLPVTAGLALARAGTAEHRVSRAPATSCTSRSRLR